MKVRLGEYDVSVTTEQLPYEELDVSHIVVHPEFNNLSLANDIALVRFVKPARRRPHIDVACMPHPGQISEAEGTRCVVTGWGRKSEGEDSKKLTNQPKSSKAKSYNHSRNSLLTIPV